MADKPKDLQDDPKDDEELLVTIRDDFRYCREFWAPHHEEAEKDMNCVACIPPSEFSDDRKNRPCIWPDETSQYLKQTNNNFRQNERSIKISPRFDATDADAEHRQSYIRGIEDASKAPTIYDTAFEQAVECSMGFWRINCRITGRKGEQEPRLVRIPNQFTVYLDPDAKEADFSDGEMAFVIDRMRQTKFARKYPTAHKRSFTQADFELAPGWFSGQDIIIAEAWRRKELDKEDGERRWKVRQYITNGIEILETNEWIGSWIPIIGVFGEEIFTRESGESRRKFLSMIRRARGQQTMLAYIASQEAEEIGMAPRAPLQGFKGQFDSKIHANLHKEPRAYVEFKIPLDWKQEWGPPPLPTRSAFTPNLQEYEVAYERYRRGVQAAMGGGFLPTAAQQRNEKSGIALEKIQDEQAIGSWHFIGNFKRSLNFTGIQLNELITILAKLDSLPKVLRGKDQKGEDTRIHVVPQSVQNLPEYLAQKQLDPSSEHLTEADFFFAHRGQFEVTVSDGPSYLSQRDEASAFADTLLQTLPALGLPPQIVQQVLAIAVKLKNIGAYGQEIADLLAPPDPNNIPPQAKALVMQAQAQTQQAMAEVQQLRLEKMGKVVEAQGKIQLHAAEHETRMLEADKDRLTKIEVAEIMTKFQNLNERLTAWEELMKQFHSQAHELAMAIQTHNQAKELAAQQAALNPPQPQPSASAEGVAQ